MIAIVVIEMFEVVEEFKVPPWGFGVGMLPWMRGSRKMIQIISDAQSITHKLEKIKNTKNKSKYVYNPKYMWHLNFHLLVTMSTPTIITHKICNEISI